MMACDMMKVAEAHEIRNLWSQNLNPDQLDFTDCAFSDYTASSIAHSGDIQMANMFKKCFYDLH